MTVVVDTSILIDHLRGDKRAREAVESTLVSGQPRPAASVMTKVEVLAGVRSGEEAATQRLLAVFRWVSVDEQLAERAGELARRYLRSHPGVDPVDYVVAATAESLNAELWTRNIKHFPILASVRDPLLG